LFVGRLRNCVKGGDKLLRIWNEVESLFPDWQLDIVGDGEDRGVLEMQADNLGLKHVTFHGFQNPALFYQRSRIFCMTSIYEGFGLVLTEAMQHGVVPMAFNSYRSVKDIIDDNINGILIKSFDEKEYADKLIGLMNDEEKYIEMSYAAMLKSAVFSKEIIVKKWCNLIENL
jgi:glycosyltransferase involved in cell wall biosynthesis